MIATLTIPRLRRPAFVTSFNGLAVVTARAWPGLNPGDRPLTIRPAALPANARAYAPTLMTGAVFVMPSTMDSRMTAFPPRVIAGSSAIVPPVLLAATLAYPPAILPGAVAVRPDLLPNVATPFAPVVQATVAGTIAPALLASTAAAVPPVVQPGGVAILPMLFGSAAAIYAPVVQLISAGVIMPSALASTTILYAPSVGAGAVSVAPALQGSAAQAYAPSIQPGAATVSPSLVLSGGSGYAPTMLLGTVGIMPAMLATAVAIYAPAVQPGAAAILPEFAPSSMVGFAPSVTVAAPSGWTRRQTATISNPGAASTGMQVPLDLDGSGFDFAAARADGADIRVTAADGTTKLPYWIEAFDPVAQTGRIWAKVPALPAGGSVAINLFYGNAAAVDAQDGAAVFEFFDDFAGVPGWNRYKVTNPVVTTNAAWKPYIVGDPMVIPPDAVTDEWGAFYFGATTDNGDIGYMRSLDGGVTWIDGPSNPVLTHTQVGMRRAIKPSVFFDAGVYHMAYAAEPDGGNWHIRYATATNRNGPWTDHGVLLTADGGAIEGNRLDCPYWLRDKAGKVRLYYSGNEAVSNEPRNFNLATADSFAGPFVRSAANPLAVPNPAISWLSTGLGGMSVRQLDDGTFDMVYNAFDANGTSRMGATTSADGITWTLKASDLMFDLGPPGAWDRVKLYRPSRYTSLGVTRMLYNALGDTENIGYAEFGRSIDEVKWKPVLWNQPRLAIDDGKLTIEDATQGGASKYFTMTSAFVPSVDMAIETSFRVDQLYNGGAEYAPTILADVSAQFPFPNDGDNQFVFAVGGEIRHQSRSAGSWGSEDTIAPLVTGQFLRSKVTKRATSMDYEIRNASGAVLGSISGNTDAPQGTSMPLSFGSRMAKATHDWYRVRKAPVIEPSVTIGAPTAVSTSL